MAWAATTAEGYDCPLSLTHKQAAALAGNVTKGGTGELAAYAGLIRYGA